MSKRMIQLIFDDDTLPVLFCPWRTSLCDVFLAELSYHSLVLFFSLPVTYVLYRNSAAPGFVKMILDKRARLGYNHLQTR